MARRVFGQEIEQYVNLDDLNGVIAKLNQLGVAMTLQERRKILRRAAGPVRQRAINLTRIGRKKVKYRYTTPKLFKNKRARDGSAKQYRIKYLRGNLKKSIQVLTFVRDKSGVYIGPKRGSKLGLKEYGATIRTSDGYYAQMIYGSAAAFGNRVTDAALRLVQRQVVAIIEDGVRKIVKGTKAKTGL